MTLKDRLLQGRPAVLAISALLVLAGASFAAQDRGQPQKADQLANPAASPTGTGEPSATPEPTSKGVDIRGVLTPSETPDPSETPEPTQAAEPTETPDPSETPEPTQATEPAETPEPSASPSDGEHSGGDGSSAAASPGED